VTDVGRKSGGWDNGHNFMFALSPFCDNLEPSLTLFSVMHFTSRWS
jgi:hypothetical protein